MNKSDAPSTKPSAKALQAAAVNRLAEMVKDSKVKPSAEAVEIAARLLANRAEKGSPPPVPTQKLGKPLQRK